MALNIHVLPQAGVFIGFHVVTGAPVEVHRHPSRIVAATGRAEGADLPLRLLAIVEAERQSVFCVEMEPALCQASDVPKVVCGPPAGRAAMPPGLSPMRSRFLAEWARDARTSRSPGSAWPFK